MPFLDAAHWALTAAFAGLLAWAAVSDVVSRRIPNLAVLALIGLFGLWTLAGAPATLGSAIAAAAIGFVVGFGFYLFNIMGAGDVKLFAATALYMGLAYLPMFALATVLAGGLMAAVSLLARPRRTAVMIALRGRGDHGRGIPYGVAISIGGLMTLSAAAAGIELSDILHPPA
jgi:prepilin peptidase CpaA